MNIENVIESGIEAMKKALKPCPFCGCNVINLHQETNADGYFFAWFECRMCGARGQTRRYMGVTFDPTLRDTWNNRKDTETKKRGKWIFQGRRDKDGRNIYHCSECNFEVGVFPYNFISWRTHEKYCAGCGAEMAEEAVE